MPVFLRERSPHTGLIPTHGVGFNDAITDPQNSRPIEILLVVVMAGKELTTRLLSHVLAGSRRQINLTLATTDSWMERVERGHTSKHDTPEFIRRFMHPYDAVSHNKYDGVIFTGFNALEDTVAQERIYPELCDMMIHSDKQTFSTLNLCYSGKIRARMSGIESHKNYSGREAIKTFDVPSFVRGPFPDETGLLEDLPEIFSMPVARWKNMRLSDFLEHPTWKVLATSQKTGPGIIVETEELPGGARQIAKQVILLTHPEYSAEAMDGEYRRDRALGVNTPYAEALYENGRPVNSWRSAAQIYRNWVDNSVYPALQSSLGRTCALPGPTGPSVQKYRALSLP